jgi:nicotinic acid phosphoribosyltransferase
VKPLNIVIKVVAAARPGWPISPAIKLSDDSGKETGDMEYVTWIKRELGV